MTAFDDFWSAYPRKTNKAKARIAFAKAIDKTTLGTMLLALRWQVTQIGWIQDEGRFIPYPATWLNGEQWENEPPKVVNVRTKTLSALKAIYEDDDGDDDQ